MQSLESEESNSLDIGRFATSIKVCTKESKAKSIAIFSKNFSVGASSVNETVDYFTKFLEINKFLTMNYFSMEMLRINFLICLLVRLRLWDFDADQMFLQKEKQVDEKTDNQKSFLTDLESDLYSLFFWKIYFYQQSCLCFNNILIEVKWIQPILTSLTISCLNKKKLT